MVSDPKGSLVDGKKTTEERMLKWFEVTNLEYRGRGSRLVAKEFLVHAEWICDLIPPSAERTVALRKLLESREAALRAVEDLD